MVKADALKTFNSREKGKFLEAWNPESGREPKDHHISVQFSRSVVSDSL